MHSSNDNSNVFGNNRDQANPPEGLLFRVWVDTATPHYRSQPGCRAMNEQFLADVKAIGERERARQREARIAHAKAQIARFAEIDVPLPRL